jgi:hypothetical protein
MLAATKKCPQAANSGLLAATSCARSRPLGMPADGQPKRTQMRAGNHRTARRCHRLPTTSGECSNGGGREGQWSLSRSLTLFPRSRTHWGGL